MSIYFHSSRCPPPGAPLTLGSSRWLAAPESHPMEPEDVSQDFTGAGDLGYSQASQPFAFESQDDGPSQQVRHPHALSMHATHPTTHSPVCCAGLQLPGGG
jgi:hypothetical protein